ncbi:MAG: hypothetical protein RIC55_36175 [Pirellulaceae bacterium]
MLRRVAVVAIVSAWACVVSNTAALAQFRSHPPTRPLPTSSDRAMADGPALFVDAKAGDDRNDGSRQRPWKTLTHAVEKLSPGDTLYLRGGVYFEHVTVKTSGDAGRPITLRAYPGELAVLDGGIAEFQLAPESAWEPAEDGADGEFRSVKAYPGLARRAEGTNLLGNFLDSMVPLHGYHFLGDLRSDNPYWNVTNKVGDESYVYCGPGVWYDAESGRIHARLAHTTLPGLHDDNYRGETDPRKTPLVIAGMTPGPVLTLDGVDQVRLQDLVLRGARDATLDLRNSTNIELDGLTIYGGSAPIRVQDCLGLRMQHTACRGLAAPWTFRGSLKYRAIESRLFSASGWNPTGAPHGDFEIAFCEFTDSVDGVFLGNASRVRFHHNYLDNVSDDGIFVTARTAYDGTTPGGDVQIYQNLLARCLTTFAFGVGHGRQRTIESGKQTGSGVEIFRNVFDFRRPVMYYWPTSPDAPQELSSLGRVGGDHGSPAWEPMRIYHNTILAGGTPRYDYGSDGLAKAMGKGTSRRVFNNIVCQKEGLPGAFLPDPTADFQADGNLFWSLAEGENVAGDFFGKFRGSEAFTKSKVQYEPGWTAHDQFAEPQFTELSSDWRAAPDLRLKPSSPAIDAGVPLPPAWPDPLRDVDSGEPDIGAIPRGGNPWPVGVHGRLTVFGAERSTGETPGAVEWRLDRAPSRSFDEKRGRALVYQGYPAFDAPLLEFALRKSGMPVDVLERTWLDPAELANYRFVAIDGNFTRAKIEPDRFREQDLPHVRRFLEAGGTLLLLRERTDLFASPHGNAFLAEFTGERTRIVDFSPQVLKPEHAWIKHLRRGAAPAWLTAKAARPLSTTRGESLIGDESGASLLWQARVGAGRLIYIGWSPAASLPHGRLPSTLEQETAFEQQMQVLQTLIDDATRRPE